MKRINETTKEIILRKGEMAVIQSESARSCDNIHLHGDDELEIKLNIETVEYEDGSIRCYIFVYINGLYTATFYGHLLEDIIH